MRYYRRFKPHWLHIVVKSNIISTPLHSTPTLYSARASPKREDSNRERPIVGPIISSNNSRSDDHLRSIYRKFDTVLFTLFHYYLIA